MQRFILIFAFCSQKNWNLKFWHTFGDKQFSTKKDGKIFGRLLKISYLCSVERKMGDFTMASQKLCLGLTKFTACPARKNTIWKATDWVSWQYIINIWKNLTLFGGYKWSWCGDEEGDTEGRRLLLTWEMRYKKMRVGRK